MRGTFRTPRAAERCRIERESQIIPQGEGILQMVMLVVVVVVVMTLVER